MTFHNPFNRKNKKDDCGGCDKERELIDFENALFNEDKKRKRR